MDLEQYNRLKQNNLLSLPVLDNGFIKVLDWMGTDKDIVKSARVSYGKHEEDKTEEQDKRLIDYLIEHGHSSPLEQVQIRLHVKMPIFVARQWIRHRTWSVNEISGRYTELENEFYLPDNERVQGQDSQNKQGSCGALSEDRVNAFLSHYIDDVIHTFTAYSRSIERGVAKETARISLPLSTYTQMIFSVDLHNLLKFLSLRSHETAQWEIQEYARGLEKITASLFPSVYESYMNHHRQSLKFSGEEVIALKDVFEHLLKTASPSTEYEILKWNVKSRHWKEKIERLLNLKKRGVL